MRQLLMQTDQLYKMSKQELQYYLDSLPDNSVHYHASIYETNPISVCDTIYDRSYPIPGMISRILTHDYAKVPQLIIVYPGALYDVIPIDHVSLYGQYQI
jgi:hypothetical protein